MDLQKPYLISFDQRFGFLEEGSRDSQALLSEGTGAEGEGKAGEVALGFSRNIWFGFELKSNHILENRALQ